jgi:hypothetical protein
MDTTMTAAAAPAGLERFVPTRREVTNLAIGGFAGLMAWEVFARAITPQVLGGPLEPAGLIQSLFERTLGFNPTYLGAEALHYATGILFYPLAYWVLTRVARLGSAAEGLLWGIATWVIALGLFASIAGLPFMLGWIGLTWMSLVGHVIYAQVAVALFHDLEGRG